MGCDLRYSRGYAIVCRRWASGHGVGVDRILVVLELAYVVSVALRNLVRSPISSAEDVADAHAWLLLMRRLDVKGEASVAQLALTGTSRSVVILRQRTTAVGGRAESVAYVVAALLAHAAIALRLGSCWLCMPPITSDHGTPYMLAGRLGRMFSRALSAAQVPPKIAWIRNPDPDDLPTVSEAIKSP